MSEQELDAAAAVVLAVLALVFRGAVAYDIRVARLIAKAALEAAASA